MKVFAVFVCCLPFVLAMPERRMLLNIGTLFDFTTLKNDLQLMLDVLGADPTEGACEIECHELIQDGHVLNYGCPIVCRAFQTLIKQFSLIRQTKGVNNGFALTSLPQAASVKQELVLLADHLSSEASEDDCITVCETLITEGEALNYACPVLCSAFQSIAHESSLPAQAQVPTGIKRLALDSLPQAASVKQELVLLADHLSSEASEDDCVTVCETLITEGEALNYACPVLCRADAKKRLVLDSFNQIFHIDSIKDTLQLMLDVLGSDPTEQACENECHSLLSQGHVLNYGCPFVCREFQMLVSSYKLTTPAP